MVIIDSEVKNKSFLHNQYLISLVYLFFLVANLMYLDLFVLRPHSDPTRMSLGNLFYFALNLDQEHAYIPHIHQMEAGTFRATFDNTAGISYLYYYLKQIFGFSYEDLPVVSFIVNNLAILLSYYYFVKIGLHLGFSMSRRWLFFLNPALIYYSQLINKEILSLLFILAFTYYLGQRQYFKLLIFSLLSILVRMQLGVIGFFSFLLYGRRRYILGLFVFYLFTSLIGAVLSRPEVFNTARIDRFRTDRTIGLAMLTRTLNQKYYIGSLLLNPIKIVQYVYDQFRCLWNFITPDGRIHLYNLRDVPISLVFLYYFRSLLKLFYHIRIYSNTVCRPLLTVTIVFAIVLLMNPIVHARFLFPISYNLLFLAIYVSEEIKKLAKEKQTQQTDILQPCMSGNK